MRAYFSYLGRVLLRQASVWIIMGVYWLYTLVLLIIVPALAKVAPMTLWSNTSVFNLQWTFVLIISVSSAILVVFCFRQGVEEETELIILSKPIKRIKISLVKFAWVIIGGLIMGLGSAIIAIFTLALGKFDSVSNPKGMEYDKLIILMSSLIVACLIITLFFGSLAILISLFANKLQVIVAIVSVAIVMQVYAMITQFTLESMEDKINNKISDDNLISASITSFNGTQSNYAYVNAVDKVDLYDLYEELYSNTNSYFSYFNFLDQLSDLYNMFDLDSLNDSLLSTTFGANAQYNTKMYSKQDNLENLLVQTYNNLIKNQSNDYILALPYWYNIYNNNPSNFSVSNTSMGFMFSAISMNDLSLLNYVGASSQTVWTSNLQMFAGLVPVLYGSRTDFQISPETKQEQFNEEVFNEIIVPILTQTSPSTKKTWRSIYSNDEVNSYFDSYLTYIIKPFITNHADEYGLKYDTQGSINKTYGLIQYHMLQQFCNLYWSQILPTFLGTEGLDTFLDNMTKSSDEFSRMMKANVGEIINPYTQETVISNTESFSTMSFIIDCYAYTGINNFKSITGYMNMDSNSFPSANYPINTDFTYDREPTPNRPQKYVALTGFDISLNNSVSYTYNNIYKYDTVPYVSTKTTTIVWVSVGFILLILSALIYQRTDIK